MVEIFKWRITNINDEKPVNLNIIQETVKDLVKEWLETGKNPLDNLESNRFRLDIFDFVLEIADFLDFLKNITDNKENNIHKEFSDIRSILIDFLKGDYNNLIRFMDTNIKAGPAVYNWNHFRNIEKWEVNALMNKKAKSIDFAKLGYIVHIIKNLNSKLSKYVWTSDWVNLDWDILLWIIESENDEEITNIIEKSKKELHNQTTRKKDENKPQNWVYTETAYSEISNDKWKIQLRNYKFNREDLNTIQWHAWIVPLKDQLSMIENSWLLKIWETIKSSIAKGFLLPWVDITFERNWNKINIKNSKTWDILNKLIIEKITDSIEEPSHNYITIDWENWKYNSKRIMHSKEWYQTYSENIPKPYKYNFIEYIWFGLLNWLLNDEEQIKILKWISSNTKFKNFNFSNLKWFFTGYEKLYQNPNFENLIEENNSPIIRVIDASASWPLIVPKIELITNDWKELIWRFKVKIA